MQGFFPKPFDFRLLPDDLKRYIFNMLTDPKDLLNTARSCKNWYSLSDTKLIWNKFGFSSRQEFLNYLRGIKDFYNQEEGIKRSIFLLGMTQEYTRFQSSIIPISHWFFSYNKGLITQIEDINIKNFKFSLWHSPNSSNDEIFLEFRRRSTEKPIVLAFVKNKKDIEQYQNLIKKGPANTLLLFITDNKEFCKGELNLLLWEPPDDLYSFYTKMVNKIEEVANLMALKSEDTLTIFTPCRIV